MTSILMFCDKTTNQIGQMHKCIVMMMQPFSPLHKSGLLLLSAFASLSDNILCSMSGHEVEIHDELCPHNQNTQSASLSYWTKPALPFWVW